LALLDENEATKNWEYAVLVCDTPYKLEHMGQLYRDRADCRIWRTRGFDEIKTSGAGAATARKTSSAAR